MCEAHFRCAALLRYLEDDVGSLPLRVVLNETEVVVENVPNHFLFRDEFGDTGTWHGERHGSGT